MDTDHRTKGPRACTTCAKAKARCISGPDGSNKCERCHRLRKPCGSQTPAPPRAKKEPKPTKVSELEKRLDELTTQLSATTQQPHQGGVGVGVGGRRGSEVATTVANGTVVGSANSPLPPSGSIAPASARIPINCDHLFPPEDVIVVGGEGGWSDTSPAPSASTADDHHTVGSSHTDNGGASGMGSTSATANESPWPLNNEQSKVLKVFLDDMQPLYPFVIVPPHMSPTQLAAERPFLWKGIMMTACHLDATKQVLLGEELLQDIVQAAFMKPKKSLDVLQGLQLLIAWYHYNINSYQLTNLLFLARSMCVSLGFKDSPMQLAERGGKGTGLSISFQKPESEARKVQTPEQISAQVELMRAFAGCYYLNTLDALLVHLFKIQQLAQTISLTLGTESTSFQSLQLPLTMVVQSFQQQLDIFKTSLPEHLKDNVGLLAHISIAQVLLYEIGIPEAQGPASFISLTERLELLWGCCSAAKQFLEIRFPRNHLSLQPRFTCLSSSDFLYVFIVCLKLMTLDQVPGWDLPLVQKHLDLGGVVESQVAHLEVFVAHRSGKFRRAAADAAAARGEEGEATGPATDVPGPKVVDPFVRLTEMLRYFKDIVKGELCGLKSQPAIQDPIQLPANLSDGTQAMIRDLDASFWTGVLGEDAAGTWDVGSMFPSMDWTAT
ncbi:hypothetical protein CSIM01_01350 [Colletotrichum simmondsii]|uniref:Zn(2)-C6 fungal-type domain-containing protein n=1 Tax=Colletotrichum simmondsii TaxID=703756 RepID=A0A135S4A7_9PEZI|nr:hypothetical protein CSIM01_01350 [Colletotrichum simmondsii]